LEVLFDGVDLGETFANMRDLRRKHGAVRAKKIEQRLKSLREAKTLADMRYLPGRCHELHGDLAGHLTLDLDHPYRLLIRPTADAEPGSGGGLDWAAVSAVVVLGVVDTHS
jgi:plasmid maintenance system killer protein